MSIKPVFLLLVLLSACATPSSNPPSQINGTYGLRLDQMVRENYPSFSGVILVARQGGILLNKGYGLADQENNLPNTSQTKFAIGSVTKSFTAMAIMMLTEQKRLSLQDSICRYLSNCPMAWETISLHQLLTHTSGIYDLSLNQDFQKLATCEEHTPQDLMPLFKDHVLDFPPGSQFHYSSSGYVLLGMVIEKVTGEKYEDFVRKYILQPLRMTSTDFNHSSHLLSDRAIGYSEDSWTDQTIKAPCYDSSMFYGDGGLYSTVGDLYRWDQALYTNHLVSQESLSQIFTSSVTVVASPGFLVSPGIWYYGYGWMLTEQSGHRLIKHGGRVPGFTAYLARYPDDRVTIIILSNWDRLNPIGLSDELATIPLGSR